MAGGLLAAVLGATQEVGRQASERITSDLETKRQSAIEMLRANNNLKALSQKYSYDKEINALDNASDDARQARADASAASRIAQKAEADRRLSIMQGNNVVIGDDGTEWTRADDGSVTQTMRPQENSQEVKILSQAEALRMPAAAGATRTETTTESVPFKPIVSTSAKTSGVKTDQELRLEAYKAESKTDDWIDLTPDQQEERLQRRVEYLRGPQAAPAPTSGKVYNDPYELGKDIVSGEVKVGDVVANKDGTLARVSPEFAARWQVGVKAQPGKPAQVDEKATPGTTKDSGSPGVLKAPGQTRAPSRQGSDQGSQKPPPPPKRPEKPKTPEKAGPLGEPSPGGILPPHARLFRAKPGSKKKMATVRTPDGRYATWELLPDGRKKLVSVSESPPDE